MGTGTVAPHAERTAACHWVARGDLRILLDCGAGSLHRLAHCGLPWPRITHVILSHFHPDHYGELPMLVYALKYTTVPARREPLVVLGPPGVVRLVKVEGNHHVVVLNGIEVLNFTDPGQRSTDGYIALQLHSGGLGNMRFKDIWIRDLSVRTPEAGATPNPRPATPYYPPSKP